MSHLTAPPYHTTLPFTFPRESITSNQTRAERGYKPTTGATLTSTTDGPMSEDIPQSTHSEIPLLPQNRRHSLSYQNSGFRDSSSRPVHRNYRYFVVVIPPSRLIQEHGQLGHTLSFGPPHRLSQGIVMPLFPTMYGQLNAIAKEFNFPSTTGLCLYLQLNEDGVTITPRVSDESWHMLWNNLFDTPSVGRGPPIGGRIEFDIDFGQARWYSSWLSTTSQDHIERSTSRVPSLATLLFHTHRDTVNEDGHRDLDNINPHLSHPRSTVRHIPRKLSLVDRFDTPSGGQDLSGPGQSKAPFKVLSPIAQEDQPKLARHQLDDRVWSWRASAIMATASLANSQADPEPMNLPNHIAPHNNTPTNPESELNIEDFTWSISSLGPGDHDVMSVGIYSNCLPSPDIANRMLDDSPPTPSTATTWGAPSYCLSSTLDHFESSSLDLGFRNTFSRPLTPTTVTSWGPASPAVSVFDLYHEVSRPRSVHLAERGVFSHPATPTTATSWGAPLSYPPTPITPYHVSTPDAAQRTFDHAKESGTLVSHPGPVENTWNFVWPYLKVADINTVRVMQEQGYSEISIYPPVYPNFDLYPASAASTSANQQIDTICSQPETIFVTASQFPRFDLYPSVPPHFNLYSPCKCSPPVEEGSITLYGVYPNLTIYPAVYPCFDFYPGKAAEAARNRSGNKLEINVSFPSLYLCINIKTPAYPKLEFYPALVASKGDTDSSMTSSLGPAASGNFAKSEITTQVHRYPIICPYASIYPHLEPYPSLIEVQNDRPLIKQFDLLPGGTGYPFFDLYPPLAGSVEAVSSPQHSYPFPHIYPPHPFHPRVHGLMMTPQFTQLLPQNSTRGAATTVTKICITRRRKFHWELHEEVFRGNLVHGPGDTNADVHCESVRRPQSIKCLRDNRRIAMTRSPTGPAFQRPTMPPAMPSMNHKVSSASAMCDNVDSYPPHVFDGMTVHPMATSSARQHSPMTSSPSRTTLAAAQRASMVAAKSADSKQHNGSGLNVNVPRMASTGLSKSSSTGNGVKLTRRTQY